MWIRIVGARSAEQSVINTDGQVQKICDVFGMRDMLERFYPYEYADSVFAIDYEKLYALGYRGIIFDVDNTLVPLNADSTEEIDGLFRQIHAAGFRTVILSDNSEERVRRFLRNIDSPFLCRAGKPDPENFAKAVRMMRVGRDRAVVIGDQIFMDIFGANRCGLASILVAFIRQPGETTFGKRRAAEEVIMSFYRRNPAMRHRIGDIRKEDYTGKPPEKLRFREISPACRAVSMGMEKVFQKF